MPGDYRLVSEERVKLIKDIDSGFTLDGYRDDIPINARGQRKLASVMEKVLKKNLYFSYD